MSPEWPVVGRVCYDELSKLHEARQTLRVASGVLALQRLNEPIVVQYWGVRAYNALRVLRQQADQHDQE